MKMYSLSYWDGNSSLDLFRASSMERAIELIDEWIEVSTKKMLSYEATHDVTALYEKRRTLVPLEKEQEDICDQLVELIKISSDDEKLRKKLDILDLELIGLRYEIETLEAKKEEWDHARCRCEIEISWLMDSDELTFIPKEGVRANMIAAIYQHEINCLYNYN